MAIYTERVVRVNNNKASMDKDIFIYRGNRNIEIQFTIVDHQFKFKDTNLIDRVGPTHAYVTLLTPQLQQVGTGKAQVIDGVIRLTVSSAMIDEKTECGEYTIVIDLYDEVGDAVITIPPIENQLHVLDRVTEIEDIPDELRFQFNEYTGDLDIVNINTTYDGNGEIKTIEGILLADTNARRDIERLKEDMKNVEELVSPVVDDVNQSKEDIYRIDETIKVLTDSGYHQIKSDMTQEQIQNELNKGGLIIFRTGTYDITSSLIIPSGTRILAESEVTINMSGNVALNISNAKDVVIDGNITLNGAGIIIDKCVDVIINNICVNAAINGVSVTGGDNVIFNNLITQECSAVGVNIANSDTPMNVIFDNHIDIQSTTALNVDTNSDVALAGRVKIIKPFYEIAETTSPCIKLNNDINAPKVIIDGATLQVNDSKDVVIAIVKDNQGSHKLGNIDVIQPHLMGAGNVNTFIKVQNETNESDIARVKIIKPEKNVSGNAAIQVLGDISSNRSIILDLDNSISKEVSNDISLSEDLCSMYIQSAVTRSNAKIIVDSAPVNFECSFVNYSSTYPLVIEGSDINGKTAIELKHNDYMKIKNIGNGKWTILDENFKEKMVYVRPINGVLNVINARYLYTDLSSDVEMVLPVAEGKLNEIHLFVRPSDVWDIVYPDDVKWTSSEPMLDAGGVYEFILTYMDGTWLIGCVPYV